MNHKKIDRREFLGRTGLGAAAAGMGLPAIERETFQPSSLPDLVYRTLGRTGLRIPVVSFGVMNTNSNALIRYSIDAGINHLDTANVYLDGNSERAIGEVLNGRGKRDDIYISTKMRFARDRVTNVFISQGSAPEPLATEENFNSQLETSLSRLQTDYIDILYLHSCYSAEMAVYEPMMECMVKAKESGKARFIGVSTHKNVSEVIGAAVDAGVYDVIQIAYNYRGLNREEIKKANRYAAEHNVGIIAMKVMGGTDLNQDATVQVDHKAALRWVIDDENICTTIPGMTTFEQLELNLSVMSDLSLSPGENRELEIASLVQGSLYCQNCRSCISTCTNSVEIPNLMRAFMYERGYGNSYQAGRTIAELPFNTGIDTCRECSACTAECVNGLQIRDRIKALIAEGY